MPKPDEKPNTPESLKRLEPLERLEPPGTPERPGALESPERADSPRYRRDDPELERIGDLTDAVRELTGIVRDLADAVKGMAGGGHQAREHAPEHEREHERTPSRERAPSREYAGREGEARLLARDKRGEQGRTPNDALRLYSALTHFVGMGLSIAGLALLVVFAAREGTVWHVVGFSIYGACMTLLYAASAFYHSLRLSPRGRRFMRKLDHTMIYVFIAGVYTPICFLPLREYGGWGWAMFGVVWGLALLGTVFKTLWITAPRWLSVLSYILMGWMAAVCIYPLVKTMPAGGLAWLFAGGVFYTAGGVCYALKWPGRDAKWFGFHEVFHVLVLFGSVCHFVMMFRYVMRTGI